MNRCKTCKFWNPESSKKLGVCTLITPNALYSQSAHARLVNLHDRAGVVKLQTTALFGCNQHKPRPSSPKAEATASNPVKYQFESDEGH